MPNPTTEEVEAAIERAEDECRTLQANGAPGALALADDLRTLITAARSGLEAQGREWRIPVCPDCGGQRGVAGGCLCTEEPLPSARWITVREVTTPAPPTDQGGEEQ